MSGCIALVVAAGRGRRTGGDIPKQYRPVGGVPVLRRTVAAFRFHPRVDGLRVVIHPDDRELYDAAVAGFDLPAPALGGASRQESVRLGLESLENQAPARILIHDAARPFVDAGVIDRALDALDRSIGAIVAVPVVDSLKREADGDKGAAVLGGAVDRSGLWRAQTPQAFHFAEILAAHREAEGQSLSDDAAVAERAGLELALVSGNEDNFKLTTDSDFERAERMLAAVTETRLGTGFDVHAFGPGDHVWLCGVRIPHDRGLVGHSDADVGLHALADAIFGAIGAGDIGVHFPPGDPRWRGTASDAFLKHAAGLVAERAGDVVHVDVTLICESPRIRPHHGEMVRRLTEILGLEAGRVSVKATTTDGLGFTGRGEGVAAQAAATVRLRR